MESKLAVAELTHKAALEIDINIAFHRNREVGQVIGSICFDMI